MLTIIINIYTAVPEGFNACVTAAILKLVEINASTVTSAVLGCL